MKTKQAKDEPDKSIDEDTIVEPKTRARKKASDIIEDEKTKPMQDDPKTSKETKKPVTKPKAIIKKRPLGIRKTLRSKKATTKDKVKVVIKKTVTRARKAANKVEPANSQEKETIPLIPATEIKREPIEDPTSNSRSSSPKTAGRRQRLTSDMMMMKSVLADSPNSLVLGPRTSPYSMRSERSNSPLLSEGKNLRSGKPRKVKNNLLNEVVMKEQKKRRRLLSDSKTLDATEATEDCKKQKRGRSCSRDGSEISKCSDVTESDLSLSEPLNDTENKELNKKLDKSKTDLDIDIENNLQISTTEKVPSLNVDSNVAETKTDAETSCIVNEKNKKKLSLKRSTSLDSDNNNSNRLKLENFNSDIEEKLLMKTENDTLFQARSSILTSMSRTFNSKEMSKNIRKARRGRKAAAAARPNPNVAAKPVTSTITNETSDEKQETLETLSKEIDDLINDLDQNIDRDHELANSSNTTVVNNTDESQTKSVTKFYGLSKPLGDNNSITAPETLIKDREILSITNENTPSKNDDSENIRLHYEEDSVEKTTDNGKHSEITYKCNSVASIDKLMDRLKEFEEFDKRRQRQESECKLTDSKSVMVTNDVVLIPKSGADIKLKDMQSVRSPEKPLEKENVLSCFENNSAISIVKRDQVRKSLDVDLPNSVTLIKRNNLHARKESTSSNHSKEADAISIFEKSLGKDVTLTEIRKSVDKSNPASQIDLHQFATLHANTPTPNLGGVILDSNQISITPRVMPDAKSNNNDVQIISKRKSRESLSRKSSESTNESEEKMATIEKIKSPLQQVKSPSISITPTPVAAKSDVTQPIESEALPPPIENIKAIPEVMSLTTEVSKVEGTQITDIKKTKEADVQKKEEPTPVANEKVEATIPIITTEKQIPKETDIVPVTMEVEEVVPKLDTPIVEKVKDAEVSKEANKTAADSKTDPLIEKKVSEVVSEAKTVKSSIRGSKSARNSIESQPGPSNLLLETPESQKRKENVLRTLGLLTHKAAKEAKIEKLKEKERYKNKAKSGSGPSVVPTGSLKAVIKLNRGNGDRDKKKYRSSLKMTFQKSKNRSGKPPPEGGDAAEDDAYYTIERREGGAGAATDGGQRKSHYSNRLNNHASIGPPLGKIAIRSASLVPTVSSSLPATTNPETAPEPVEPKETLNLVIPEKASSFSIHPGRLCMDQCFYCGGKFGLFDTPCHIAQMKSADRQKKVLANEEKLTIDSCLCDACYRHVDRRANCPSYRKRPLVKPPETGALLVSPTLNAPPEKPPSPSLESESEEEAGTRPAACHTEGCVALADHSIRRKWLIKMRSSVNKVLKLKCDYPGLHTIPLCAEHHRALAPLQACALCRRRVTKHHNIHFIHHGFTEINPHLREARIPVQFLERPLLCKVCRVYCALLQRSGHQEPKARGYRRKLLQMYNIEAPPENENEPEESIMQEDSLINSKQKKKQRTKSKQRKSTDASESSERTTPNDESSPEKIRDDSNESISQKQTPLLEEDIESLISSNKIMVPGAMKANEHNPTSDGSESEAMYDLDTPLLPLDKQTELQYLLQKQNNPAQFLQKNTNLTQKQKNIMKLQSMSGIHKPGQQHRINEKNAKRIHKLGHLVTHKDKSNRKEGELEVFDPDKAKDVTVLKNIPLNDECTIETIPNKKPADINTLKNKWQMSESFTQVKKNLSELSKKLTVEKEPKKGNDVKYSNPVRRLETNPSISVRELFPGEEEMNLQCNIEFSNVKGITPEGWEKCNTMIQYDAETKRLWNELQRPYGNQSSFLRHLVLLEKYFRSGDLVLSHNAAPHATNYSDSVQSRLRAYDNVPNETAKRPDQPVSLIEYRKKPSMNGKSLLKSNQSSDSEKDPKKFMPPPGILPKPKSKSTDKAKSKPLPPELIAINTPNAQGRKAIQNVLHNIQQLVKGVSASDPTEVAAAPVPKFDAPKFDSPKFDNPKLDSSKFEPPKADPPKEKKDIPKSDTPKKHKATSKPWRPTLMPITAENLAKIAREPTQVAVDGRTLPSLVQVMSSGKRYHITLHDYNKMCVMRREKLQQLHDGPKRSDEAVVTEIQTSTMLGNGGTLVQNPPQEDKVKDMPELGQMTSNAATILKNVGLKNITIAPIPPKTATVTSQTVTSPIVTSPSLLVTAPMKMPQFGPAVSITSETVLNASPISNVVMPKIPKSLTVIPQTVVAGVPQNVVTQAGADPQRP